MSSGHGPAQAPVGPSPHFKRGAATRYDYRRSPWEKVKLPTRLSGHDHDHGPVPFPGSSDHGPDYLVDLSGVLGARFETNSSRSQVALGNDNGCQAKLGSLQRSQAQLGNEAKIPPDPPLKKGGNKKLKPRERGESQEVRDQRVRFPSCKPKADS
jgi:hypothetical protein